MKIKEITTNTEINLTKNNFIASGGEGEIYKIKNKCYKIYTDPSKMLPQGKIKELSLLHSPNIINPISLLEDGKGKYVGYSMKFMDDCITLCNIFPSAFKQRNNIKINSINKLILIMKSIVQEFHKNKMLIVDMNEYNFLVHDKYFDSLYLIDIDSSQTLSYPATAIMESIRDFHAKIWSEMSDWFSFAVLTFQMYTGLHPFRGKHPKIKDFPERIKQNLSVYNKDVTIPAFIQNFQDLIPKNFNEWYKIIFSSDKRDVPPNSFEGPIIKAVQKVIQKIGDFVIELFKEYDSNVILYNDYCITERGFYINNRLYENIAVYSKILKIYDKNILRYYSCIVKDKRLKIWDIINKIEISHIIDAQHIIEPAKNYSFNSEILYIINEFILYTFKIIPQYSNVSIIKITDLTYSYRLFNNVIIQQILDSTFVILLRGIDKICENIKINELSKQRIINAELNNNILIVITELKGKLRRYIIKFNIKTQYFENYIILSDEEIHGDTNINFVVLDNGICILSDLEKGLILFRSNFEDKNINIINNTNIAGYKLYCQQNKVLYADDNKLYSLKMK